MDKIKQIISEYTDIDVAEIDDNMSLQGNIGVDSFTLISLLMDIEDAFNIKIPDSELRKFQTIADIDRYIIEHTK